LKLLGEEMSLGSMLDPLISEKTGAHCHAAKDAIELGFLGQQA